MNLVAHFVEQAREHAARIVYPEGGDERIVAAAAKVKEQGIAEPIVLGDPDEVARLASGQGVSLSGVRVLSPSDDKAVARYAPAYAKARGVREAIAARLVRKPLAFAGMMVRSGDADGMVAGAASATATVIQAASLTIGFREGLSTPSSCMIVIVPEFAGETDKLFVFADCAVNISPDSRQLAEIAMASAQTAKTLLGIEPRIAFLSFSTRGSASHHDVDKVVNAVKLAQEMCPELLIDGELQGDAAIVPRIAAQKAKGSAVAGSANVLIFPDLDAGNIAYKLVQHLAGAVVLGPALQGFAKPVSDLSRGATVEEIVGATAITVMQAREG
jgi:phosphate acetyltransferase